MSPVFLSFWWRQIAPYGISSVQFEVKTSACLCHHEMPEDSRTPLPAGIRKTPHNKTNIARQTAILQMSEMKERSFFLGCFALNCNRLTPTKWKFKGSM